VVNVVNRRICEDAISIDAPDAAVEAIDIEITNNTLLGMQPPEGRDCYREIDESPPTFEAGHLCGLDKAIQVWDGSSTISGNQIDTINTPVLVKRGTHTIRDNLTWGLLPGCAEYSGPGAGSCLADHPDPPYDLQPGGPPDCEESCQGYQVSGGTATFDNNTIAYCKFGIKAATDSSLGTTGTAIVTNNKARFNYVSSFIATGGATMTGANNKAVNSGCFTGSQAERGVLVGTGGSTIDFRDHNSFCQDASLPDVYNQGSTILATGNCWGDETSPTIDTRPSGAQTTVDDPPPSCAQTGFKICGCPATPLVGCRKPIEVAESDITITQSKLKWKWKNGAATSEADFGNPLVSANYVFCVYERPATGAPRLMLEAVAPPGEICGSGSNNACWRKYTSGVPPEFRKWRYKDRELTPDGLRDIRLFAGADGKAKVDVQGRAPLLKLPASLQVGAGSRVTVQLKNTDTPVCWDADFSTFKQNRPTLLRAKSDPPTP
jgi:hypothetical protein